MTMTDDQVRAELEQIRPVLEMDFIMSKKESPHRLALTLLAETSLRDRQSQKALGEIIAECPEPKTGYGRRIVEIASNARKGGSNG